MYDPSFTCCVLLFNLMVFSFACFYLPRCVAIWVWRCSELKSPALIHSFGIFYLATGHSWHTRRSRDILLVGRGSTLSKHLDMVYFCFDISNLTADCKQNINSWLINTHTLFGCSDGVPSFFYKWQRFLHIGNNLNCQEPGVNEAQQVNCKCQTLVFAFSFKQGK